MHLIVHLTNQIFVGRIQMQMFKVRIKIQLHLQFHWGILMRIQILSIQMFNIQRYLPLLNC